MSPNLRAGFVGGLVAGVIMLFTHIGGVAARLSAYSPLRTAADVFFPSRVVLDPALGVWTGALSYLVISVIYGVTFVLALGLHDDRNYVAPAILFGIGAGLLNLGILAPAMRIMKPVWTMDAYVIILELVRHAVWGAVLGWITNVYAQLHGAQTGPTSGPG